MLVIVIIFFIIFTEVKTYKMFVVPVSRNTCLRMEPSLVFIIVLHEKIRNYIDLFLEQIKLF